MDLSIESRPAPSPADVLLKVERLSAGFESLVVFRRVSFTVPARGALGILGPSGGGKSTLLRTLGRWNDLRPSFWVHGRIEFGSKDLLSDVDAAVANRKMALLQQKARLYTSSVVENAVNELVPGDASREEKAAVARRVLEPWDLWTRLKEDLSRPVTSLELSLQRRITLARLVASGALGILADEPLRDLGEREVDAVLSMLAELKKTRALIMITHNQKAARTLLDDVVLLAGGTLAEASPALDFFEEPTTALGKRFVKDGNCWPRIEEMDPEWLAHTTREPHLDPTTKENPPPQTPKPSWIPTAKECAVRPGGFHWIEPSRLGGMQWPGLLQEESADLDGLVSLEVRHLVSLTEHPFPDAKVIPRPLVIHHFPIVDMRAPEPAACLTLCAQVDAWLKKGEATVFHCRAGLGRTGTMLACMRIFHGRSAVGAVDDVRRVNSMYIQSEEQLSFVEAFADYVRTHARVTQSDTAGDTSRSS